VTDLPQYGAAWLTDDPSGVPYIVEASGKRLYRHPPCEVCGVMCTSYRTEPMPQPACVPNLCHFAKASKNDNVHPADQDGQGVFAP
jgi:hypothetical protein